MGKSTEESWRELAEAVAALKAALLERIWDILLLLLIVLVVYVLSLMAFGDWISPLVPSWLCEECQPQR